MSIRLVAPASTSDKIDEAFNAVEDGCAELRLTVMQTKLRVAELKATLRQADRLLAMVKAPL